VTVTVFFSTYNISY